MRQIHSCRLSNGSHLQSNSLALHVDDGAILNFRIPVKQTTPAMKMTPASLRASDGDNDPELVKAQALVHIQQVFPLKPPLWQHLVLASTSV